ncbi:uncharacterized protein LOC119650612 [Hermetia illucens]|uniref:uncharacterized protein LOC119650612 n=1 Tax=Hermetia illucens TaxID=343691 RepID=UPI0018CC08CE|nr:uncharacterized protein LOC119650612 [Hermetia illucens]
MRIIHTEISVLICSGKELGLICQVLLIEAQSKRPIISCAKRVKMVRSYLLYFIGIFAGFIPIAHSCTKTITVMRWRPETQTYYEVERYKKKCNIFFKCWRTRSVVRERQISVSYIDFSEVCCDGYVLHSGRLLF